MKYLPLALVLALVTGVNILFSTGLYRPADAAPSPESEHAGPHGARPDRPAPPDRTPGAMTNTLLAAGTSEPVTPDAGDLLLARIAADCGDFAYHKAKRADNNATFLKQAAAHYRA